MLQAMYVNISYRVSGIILCMGSANERQHYNVKPPLIGSANTQNGPWSLSSGGFTVKYKLLCSS